MRRWIWKALLVIAAVMALTGTALAEEVEVGGIRYDTDTGTVLGPVAKTITQAVIQAEVGGKEITSIAANAFSPCANLETVTIPRTVDTIGETAFAGCTKLSSVELPEGLTEIPNGAFYDCDGLGTISIPAGVEKIGKRAFFSSGLNSVVLPARLETIDESAFESCESLESVTFQDNVGGTAVTPTVTPVTEIEYRAFNSCKLLSKLTLSASVKSVGDFAFESCGSLKKAVIRKGTGSIGISAFSGCPLADIVIFNPTATIGANAFQGAEAGAVIHYAGSKNTFPPNALPTGGTPDMVHEITGNETASASISCKNSGSIRESLRCLEADCRYSYNEPARTVPPLPHVLVERTARKDPTCTETGRLEQSGCENCTYVERPVSIPALGHDPQDVDTTLPANRVVTKKATCTEEGVLTIITKRCSRAGCGVELESETETLDKLGHDYTDATKHQEHVLIAPTCEEGGVKVTDRVCKVCGHVEDPTAGCATCEAYWEKEEPTDDETAAYIAHVTAPVSPADPADPAGHGGEAKDPLGHDYEEQEVRTEPTCVDDGKIEVASVCTRCGETEPDTDPVLVETLPAKGEHTADESKLEVDTEDEDYVAATCTEKGRNVYKETTCTVCGEEFTPEPEETDKLGHDWKAQPDKVITAATCTQNGEKWINCKICQREGCDYEEHEVSFSRAAHSWTDPAPDESKQDVPATCGTEGTAHVIVTCSVCQATEAQTISIPATGQHSWGAWSTTTEPTETEDGERKRVCGTCGREDTMVLPATGSGEDPSDPDKPDKPEKPEIYQITLVQGAGGSLTADRKTAEAGDRVLLTVKADSGYEVDMVRVVSAGGSVPRLTDLDDGDYRFTMPGANVEVRATFQRRNSGSGWSSAWADAPGDGSDGNPRRTTDPMPTQNPVQSVPRAGVYGQLFQDIPTSHWAAGEINWANQMGYMSGSGGRFNPDGAITHQQMWMVLARLTGSRPANMAEARRWAVEHSFAEGSDPQGPALRHQLVTALYRCAHLMGSSNRNTTSLAGYADSRIVPAAARDAFAWAVANGIVGGTSGGRLDPNGTLSRAQFAVILYRFSQRI